MNPIPLNDRGQYRYTDLVGYIPDFLKEEPDVVELLQIFSDYMNNAYRNIETVQKFDFKLCVPESTIGKAKRRLGMLQRMFETAAGRDDTVAILSVPRSNVKSDAVYGRANYPYTIDLSFEDISDTIVNANSYDNNLMLLNDGDVVYVTYTALEGNPKVSYYVSKHGDSGCDLIREPMGGSQDPFTGSDNSVDRMVTFKVSDVTSIYTRYGSTVRDCKYYEVFFTATVSDVESGDAFKHVEIGDDRLAIDYYGMHSVPGKALGTNQYYASIGFDGDDGWTWKSGYPTAIIYMLGTSVSDVTSADYNNSASLADPAICPNVTRYIVDITESSGQGLATSTSMIPLVNGMMVTMMSMDGEQLGRFNVEAVTGNPKQVRLTSADSESSIARLVAEGRAIMVASTLFYSHTVGDVTGWPRIDMLPVERGVSARSISRIYSCDKVAEMANIDAGMGHVTMLGGNKLRISGEAAATINPENGATYLYCGDTMWNGVLQVVSYSSDDTGTIVKYNTIDRDTEELTGDCRMYVVRSGFITVTDDGSVDFGAMALTIDGRMMVELLSIDGTESYARQIYNIDGDYRMDSSLIVPGKYFVTAIDMENYKGVATSVAHRTFNASSGYYSMVIPTTKGDIYGGDYYVIMDDDGNRYVYYNMNGVERYRDDKSYLVGDVVSYNGMVYRCDAQVQPGSVAPGSSEVFVDITSSYKYYERERVTNEFMPFYGQIATLEYEESIDYAGIGEPAVFTLPLYICKAEDIRLKYGWEHREYLNYPGTANRETKARNGYLEVFETACDSHQDCFVNRHDAVRYVPSQQIKWNLDYEVIRHGYESETSIYVNEMERVVARRDGDEWEVTIKSASHGLHDGCEIIAMNFPGKPDVAIDINTGYTKVNVIDGDMFTYRVPVDPDDTCYDSELLIDVPENAEIKYVGDYRYYVIGEPIKHAEDGDQVVYSIPLRTDAIGLANGDAVKLEYMFAGKSSVDAVVYADSVEDNAVLTVKLSPDAGDPDLELNTYSAVRGAIHEDDVIAVHGQTYRVGAGEWQGIDDSEVSVPVTLFAQHNIFDVTDNNPETPVGDMHTVTHMEAVTLDEAEVYTASGFEHFAENPAAVEMHTKVYIENAYPSEFNGWHTVSKVIGANHFKIQMRLKNTKSPIAVGCNQDAINIREGKWYKYTINDVEWSKVSNRATYYGGNELVQITDDYVMTRLAHGLNVGDRVVFGTQDEFKGYSASNDIDFGYGIVTAVVSSNKFVVKMIEGAYELGDGVAKGIVLRGAMNCVYRMNGEYTAPIFAEHSDEVLYNYRFMDHALVVAKAQYNTNERMVYVVNRNGGWFPMRQKRAFKIRDISVDQIRTESYFDYYDPEKVSAYTYTTYSDVEVASFDGPYMVTGMGRVGNSNFYAPALADLDSTRSMSTEYSSGEDYANVAPRTGMSRTFKGVPDMKYPLAERIERLCYLRDPNVIDYDLIGYLARFMGYDMTSVSDDIVESPVYRSKRERENAVRAAVASLPQYYTLGGTDAGLSMLMDTFGVIGRAITLWTNTDAPYGEMLTNAEVAERVNNDITGGSGTWAPTPYIDLELVHDERFPQFDCSNDDIARIREQIRTFKPINVVFRDVVEKYLGYVTCNPTMSMGPMSTNYDLGAVRVVVNDDGVAAQETLDIDYGEPDKTVSNCAF